MAKKFLARKSLPQKNSKQVVVVRALLVISSILLFAYGAWLIYNRHQVVTKPTQLPSATELVTTDTETPEESKPSTENYVVAPDQPRRILLSSIAAEGIIQKVSLTKDKAIAVPSNIHFAGWYISSVKPGQEGLSIIDGHVSGKYEDGIFKNLQKLNVGDEFSIEYGDMSLIEFEVVEVKTVPESEALQELFQKRSEINAQLNLITCGGRYNKQLAGFEDRVIVVAKRKS